MTPDEFTVRTAGIAYAHRGAFFSELYQFAKLCDEAGVTRIIESGVFHGVSTRVFRALWPGRVTSIEARPANVPDDLPGVEIGDGKVLVPARVAQYADEAVGVFIDGPKGGTGTFLRQWCLLQPNVKVVAQHDSPVGSGEAFHSADGSFGQLDDRIDPVVRAMYAPQGCPGMGVWIK